MVKNPEKNKTEKIKKRSRAYDMAVCSLGSGSSGNATYISDGRTSVLVDAGFSGIEIEKRMKSIGALAEKLNGIIVTHEHSDHIKGAGILSRRYKLPVYISKQTHKAANDKLGNLEKVHYFDCGSEFNIGGLKVHPFPISHDAADPAGFTIRKNGTKLGIATDLGIATALVKERLKGSSLVIVEANHDPDMLIKGPYPWHLKQRIKGRCGHLSNDDSKSLVKAILHKKLEHVILGHLSMENNDPEKALSVVGQALSGAKAKLSLAVQDRCGQMIYL